MNGRDSGSWIALANTDIKTSAVRFAEQMHEIRSEQIARILTEEVDTRYPANSNDADLYRAAFLWKANEALASLFLATSLGWCDDFYAILRRIDP